MTNVAAGEVTTLSHEVADDTMELAASVSEALLASAESTEVLYCLGDTKDLGARALLVLVEKLKDDTAPVLLCSRVSKTDSRS